MLGMNALHSMATRLEGTIDNGEPAAALFAELEQEAALICEGINNRMNNAPASNSPTSADATSATPQAGQMPDSVRRLVAMLDAGHGDCDKILAECIDELQGTSWLPHLKQTLIDIQHFDFGAASQRLRQQETVKEK